MLRTVFGQSLFMCFVRAGDGLVGAGRALADGRDCSYNADVAMSRNHKKIILCANPGTEEFYARLGFLRKNTAMAIWQDPASAVASWLLEAGT